MRPLQSWPAQLLQVQLQCVEFVTWMLAWSLVGLPLLTACTSHLKLEVALRGFYALYAALECAPQNVPFFGG
jgi:hypothetical protein